MAETVVRTPYEQVLELAEQLEFGQRLRLIADRTQRLQRDLPASSPRETFWGALADLGPAPSAEEIDEARREAWANFPREDI